MAYRRRRYGRRRMSFRFRRRVMRMRRRRRPFRPRIGWRM